MWRSLNSSSEVTDEQRMARIQTRDESALASMYHRHTPILRTVISRVVHNESDVDDLLHGEVFLEMWNWAASYDDDEGQGARVAGDAGLGVGRLIECAARQAYARAEERLRLETEPEPHMTRYRGVEDDVNACRHRSSGFPPPAGRALPPACSGKLLHLAYYSCNG